MDGFDSVNTGRIAKEPLLHFLLLGAALFFVFSWLNRDDGDARDVIVVDEARLKHLASRFERTWQRQPTEEEFNALVESWIRDEILYREGVSMGLDIDDPIVRRRVAQKVDVFAETLAPYSASDEQLEEWLEQNRPRYRVRPSYSFRQVFFDAERHGERLDAVIGAAGRRLGADPNAVAGDATMLPSREASVDATQIARTFGTEFAAALDAATPGEWYGPIRSGFGWHLVLIEARTEGRDPDLSEVRAAVERDYLADRIAATKDAFYEEVRKTYTVRIERGEAGSDGS